MLQVRLGRSIGIVGNNIWNLKSNDYLRRGDAYLCSDLPAPIKGMSEPDL